MAHVTRYNADYSFHGIVRPGEIHHVVLALPHRGNKLAPIIVTNRNGADALWFDWTYPDGSPPITETLDPGDPNTFVVLPCASIRIDPVHLVTEVALTSHGIVAYSVMAIL